MDIANGGMAAPQEDLPRLVPLTEQAAMDQSSNGSRIIQELRHRSTTEASAGSEAAKRILFCTSVVAEAPGIALASVFTGAPFITGAPVAAYVF